MTLRRLRRQCAERVRRLDVPVPFDLHALCAHVGRLRSRRVRLVPLPLPIESPCGLWVATEAADLILYDTRTSAPHSEHIVLHELGHLVCEHEPVPVDEQESSRLVLPHLDPAVVRRVLGRTAYAGAEEQEAELVGSLLAQRAERTRGRRPPAPDGTGARLARALEGPGDR